MAGWGGRVGEVEKVEEEEEEVEVEEVEEVVEEGKEGWREGQLVEAASQSDLGFGEDNAALIRKTSWHHEIVDIHVKDIFAKICYNKSYCTMVLSVRPISRCQGSPKMHLLHLFMTFKLQTYQTVINFCYPRPSFPFLKEFSTQSWANYSPK